MINAEKLVRTKAALSWWEEGPCVGENHWIVWVNESGKAMWGKVERAFEDDVKGRFMHWVKRQDERWTVIYDPQAKVFRGDRGWFDEYGFTFHSDEHLQMYVLKLLVYQNNDVGSFLSILKDMNIHYDPITFDVSGLPKDMQEMYENYIIGGA